MYISTEKYVEKTEDEKEATAEGLFDYIMNQLRYVNWMSVKNMERNAPLMQISRSWVARGVVILA